MNAIYKHLVLLSVPAFLAMHSAALAGVVTASATGSNEADARSDAEDYAINDAKIEGGPNANVTDVSITHCEKLDLGGWKCIAEAHYTVSD
ncbi:hypothetical protein ACEUZ9_001056 [Paracoccus litorisediminis]|uniref:hypothetical protein n=1 Tax=Paracoccus litorisediminis TaxID=2006130 RepID=UPI003730E2EC